MLPVWPLNISHHEQFSSILVAKISSVTEKKNSKQTTDIGTVPRTMTWGEKAVMSVDLCPLRNHSKTCTNSGKGISFGAINWLHWRKNIIQNMNEKHDIKVIPPTVRG